MEQFAGYGFNKSHSAAYAYLAYVTAYLKAHYPLEFMSALLTSETGNTAKVVKYINECREMGISVLPPDVNSSDLDFTPESRILGRIRFGLVRDQERRRGGRRGDRQGAGRGRPVQVAVRFLRAGRSGAVNRRMIESLIKAGAMDSLERHALAVHRRPRFRHGDRAACLARSGQRADRTVRRMFGRRARKSKTTRFRTSRTGPAKEKLSGEKEMLGFYVTGHPLDRYMDKVVRTCHARHATRRGS